MKIFWLKNNSFHTVCLLGTSGLRLRRSFFGTNLQPDLSGNPFFVLAESDGKKDWERKAEMSAQIKSIVYVIFDTYQILSVFLWKPDYVKLLDQISKYIKIDPITEDFFRTETQTKTFPKGELLSHQNSYNRNVYYMEQGLARTYYFEKGKDITTNFYSEGKSFGSIDTIFSNVPSIYNIETLEESTITFCDYKKLEELCSVSLTSANFSRFILGNLMTQMSKRVNSLQHMTAKEKYAQLLEENPNIILRAPLGMIASYLGISQETLSRIRSEI